jgi:uncharacterized membrane protein YfcA
MELIFPIVVLSVAATVTGVAGFGLGLVSMGLLSYFIGLKDANVVVTLVGLCLVTSLLIPLRQHIKFRNLLLLLIGMLGGTPIGVFIIAHFDEHIMKRILGGFILCYFCYELFLSSRVNYHFGRKSGVFFGLLSGTFEGAFSTGGPPVVLYITSQRWDKYTTKATVLSFFMGVIMVKIPLFFLNDMLTVADLPQVALFLVPGAAGGMLGAWLFKKLPQHVFRIIVQGLILFSGLLLLITG